MSPLVIIESPYAGDVVRNVEYARKAMNDSIRRGERPFASHLLYPQPGILDDLSPKERLLGIEFGYAFWQPGCLIAFYIDLGWSQGMEKAMRRIHMFRNEYYWEKRTLKLDNSTATRDNGDHHA